MKKTIIVGTVPYNTSGPSRAFESYFHGINPFYLAQVFSNPAKPRKGHCCTLFQITDSNLLHRRFNSTIKTGQSFIFDELDDMDAPIATPIEKSGKVIKFLKNYGSKHSPLAHLLRKILWKKSYWCSKEFNEWLERFSPECVFLSFSDDFFILDIAIYISAKFNIPIVFVISDDYYFNRRWSFSPAYYVYRYLYKRCVRKVLLRSEYGIYICDKIKQKYNSFFHLHGETVYLSSTLKRRIFKPIPNKPIIRYFGSVLLDRHKSLIDIANMINEVIPNCRIEVYTGRVPPKISNELVLCKSIKMMGFVPYSQICELMMESDIVLVVEGFSDYNIRSTRYSLSTKTADSLASGVNIFAYGSIECGLIDYLSKYDACMVSTNPNQLKDKFSELINNEDIQRYYYEKAIQVYEENHNLDINSKKVQRIITSAVKNWEKSND